jgi:Calcineurin-like phosphoesterase
VTVLPAPPGPGAVTLERRVDAGNNDAEEKTGGSVSLTSSDLELVFDGSNQIVGTRFTNVTVPRGATITNAYVQFETDEAHSEATNLTIHGQAVDNAPVFAATAVNISARARTAAAVAWTPPPWTLVGEAGPNQRTPNLAAPIQQIINRSGWTSGNALALIISGSGHRTTRAYEGKPAGAPLLHLEYTTVGPPQAPVNTTGPTIAGTATEGQTLRADPGGWNGTPPITYTNQWRRCDAAGAGCVDIDGAAGPTHTLAGADVGKTIRVAVTASNAVGSSTATSAATVVVSAAGSAAPVIAAAGDICNAGNDCAQTAALLDQLNPDRVLTLGDNAYQDGTLAEFMSYYEPNWGRHKQKTSPAPGNHEYQTPGAVGYFEYFGSLAPGPYYSFDVGSWHVISLNSEIAASANSVQEQWLKADLAAHPAQCVLAYWHRPRFSSGAGHGSHPNFDAFWRDLYAAGAEVVLNGHDHNYERFAAQNPDAQGDPNGIREFVVGTGGAGLNGFNTPIANSEVRNSTTYGVIKLTLHPGRFDWQFVPVAGSTFTDSGSASCH